MLSCCALQVVATYHGDHAYCFDVTSMGTTQAVYASPTTSPTFPCSQTTPDSSRQRAALQGISGWTTPGCIAHHQGSGSNGVAPSPDSMKYCNTPCNANNLTVQSGHNFAVSEHHLPEAAERAKLEGNSALFEKKWAAAVTAFTHAIKSAPWAPVLYAQRALALLQRSWEGDAAFALRDCDTAISLEQQSRGPAMMKAIDQAYYRRIHAFKALGQYKVGSCCWVIAIVTVSDDAVVMHANCELAGILCDWLPAAECAGRLQFVVHLDSASLLSVLALYTIPVLTSAL